MTKTEIYLSIEKGSFDDTKDKAMNRDIEQSGNTEYSSYLYPNLEITSEETEYNKEGEFSIYGDLTDKDSGKSLGYVSVNIKPDIDLVIDLIEFYMKKLGKLKTVLEATK